MENNHFFSNIEMIKIVVSKDNTGNPISNILPESILNRYSEEQLKASIVNVNGFNVLHCLAGRNEKGEINIVDVAVMPS